MLAMAEELQIDKTAEAVSARNCARHLSRVMQSFSEAREFGTCGTDEPMDKETALAMVASGECALTEAVAAITALKAQIQIAKSRTEK